MEVDMGTTRREMPGWESLELLGRESVGRLCIIDHTYPLAFPLNYRMLRDPNGTRFVFRTSPTSAVGQYLGPACLEVDHIDAVRPEAWSVIVRGTLRRAVDNDELHDTHPLVSTARFHWVVLDAVAISGRRFTAKPSTDEFAVEWQPVG
jgi:nitroimidazol reductase NimA-like FMN-containing flavoprotein (pyridoxamine 5'-phosphate oxidase superfamily)